MVTNSKQLDLIFGALADNTRRDILSRLSKGISTVGQLAEPFSISRPAISKHLRVLEKAGLVQRTRDGRISRCGLDAGPLHTSVRPFRSEAIASPTRGDADGVAGTDHKCCGTRS